MEISQADRMKFASMLKEMGELTNSDMSKVVRNAARDVCYSAQKNTPLVQKGVDPVYVNVNGTFVPWHDKDSPEGIKRVEQNGGLTKGIWSGCLTKLGKKRSRKHKTKSLGGVVETIVLIPQQDSTAQKKYSDVALIEDSTKVVYDVSNNIQYVHEFYAGKNPEDKPIPIEVIAITEAMQKTEATLNRMALNIAKKNLGVTWQ
jgi:hypothetical protein